MDKPAILKCATKRCRGIVRRSEHSDKCATCRRKWFKDAHPLAYSWGNLKRRARQRGIAFSLTLEEYTRFAIGTDYASMKGKTSISLCCDRIESGLGYHAFNIRAISLAENSRKAWVPYFQDKLTGDMLREADGMDAAYRDKMERLAARIGKQFQPGTPQFWKVFQAEKNAMLELCQD